MRLLAVCVLAALLAGGAGWAADEGLVGYWRFDHTGEVADLSGRGHTATVTGGEVVAEGGRKVLRLDGRTRIEVPSAPDLHLARGFSLEARVRPTDISDGRAIIIKENEYMLRVDWPIEGSGISFFPFVSASWEPRANAYKPPASEWHHLVAVWNGTESLLWVNGQPFRVARHGDVPAPTDAPLLIGSQGPYGAGFVGSIDYVRVYRRALTAAEVIKRAYGIEEGSTGAASTATVFEFARGRQGWEAREGASVAVAGTNLVVKMGRPGSLVMRGHLGAVVDTKDYLSLRMAVDRGSRAEVVFATTRGAARIPFETYADGAMHTYVLEPWQWPGWGGKLLALGLAPADVQGVTARVRYVRVTETPRAEPEVRVLRLFPQSVLPRAGRPERIVARIANSGGAAAGVRVTLAVPRGVKLAGPATQSVARLGYRQERELSWPVRASAALAGSFRVSVAAAGATPASLAAPVAFLRGLRLPRASYVPRPRPISTGRYRVWTHYCPLWKHGTHAGWKAIEPWPERKPVLGWYNEGTPEVADWHIKYWVEHGISGAVYCWYRSNLNGPVTQSLGHAIHDGLLKARYLDQIEFGIMWENGCGKGVGSHEDLMENVLPFWLDHYFTHPSYLKVDGKPVLYIWVPGNVTRDLGGSDNVRQAFEAMREKCRQRGLPGLYIVGCVGTADKPSLERMVQEGWDASSAYGNGWSPPQQLKTVGSFVCAPYEGFVDQQERIWKAKGGFGLLPDITAAMMGWDSRPWNETPFFWSENTPAKFRDLCRRAKAVMDARQAPGPGKDTAIFCCWNEFGEGHYIEPTRGCGFSYLDAIRDLFGTAPRQHTDLAPEDVGRGPYDSWYQRWRAAVPPAGAAGDTSWRGAKLAAWSGMMGLDATEVKGGVLRMASTSSDPAVSSPSLRIRASRFTRVVVEMRVSRPGTAQLFWTSASTGTSEAASAHAATVADGRFHRYVFEVGTNEYWGGCLTGMRLDPTDAAGVAIEIRAIEVR